MISYRLTPFDMTNADAKIVVPSLNRLVSVFPCTIVCYCYLLLLCCFAAMFLEAEKPTRIAELAPLLPGTLRICFRPWLNLCVLTSTLNGGSKLEHWPKWFIDRWDIHQIYSNLINPLGTLIETSWNCAPRIAPGQPSTNHVHLAVATGSSWSAEPTTLTKHETWLWPPAVLAELQRSLLPSTPRLHDLRSMD